MQAVTGWDIGGAHLKVAQRDTQGRLIQVRQIACPLWLGIEELEKAVREALPGLPRAPGSHHITMTGELADSFNSRHQGVLAIASFMSRLLPEGEVLFYAGPAGLIPATEVATHWSAIASANWHASARYCGILSRPALFMDIGSTTTDIIPVVGQPLNVGYTDAERMVSEELVYSGVIRTPVMAVARRVPFRGEWQMLAAEHFATMADVYVLSGDLEADQIQADSADGGDAGEEGSAVRLARMLGRDLETGDRSRMRSLARYLARTQRQQWCASVERVLSRLPDFEDALFVGAGVGRFQVQHLAAELGYDYIDFADVAKITEPLRSQAAVCAPAVALSLLDNI